MSILYYICGFCNGGFLPSKWLAHVLECPVRKQQVANGEEK